MNNIAGSDLYAISFLFILFIFIFFYLLSFDRFAADIFNDLAITIELISPSFPASFYVFTLCAAAVLRALCGVAAGATKAALSQHFAKVGNTAGKSK